VETLLEVFSMTDARTLFGEGSQLANMIAAAFATNPGATMKVMAIAEPAGAVATGNVAISGTATGAGAATITVAGRKVTIQVDSGDSAATLETKFVTRFGQVKDLPVTAVGDGGLDRVNLSSRHKGTEVNQIAILASTNAPGITLTPSGGFLTGGTGTEVYTNAFTVAKSDTFATYVIGANDTTAIAALKTQLESESDALNQKNTMGFVGGYTKATAKADAETQASTTNSPNIGVVAFRLTPSLPSELAAALGAAEVFEEDPARPYNGVILRGVYMPTADQVFTNTEQNTTLAKGVTPVIVENGDAKIVRLVTTKTTTSSVEDFFLLDWTKLRQLFGARDDIRATFKISYPRHKLMNNPPSGLTPPLTLTPAIARSKVLERLRARADLGWLQSPDLVNPSTGKTFASEIVAEVDAPNDRLNVSWPAVLVPGAHVIAHLARATIV